MDVDVLEIDLMMNFFISRKPTKYVGELLYCLNDRKIVTRHVWEDSKEKVKANRLSKSGKQLYVFRKQTIERSFGDAKQLHGYRYARYRGKVLEQALMTAVCQNTFRNKGTSRKPQNGGVLDNLHISRDTSF